jgi:GNAT superfamily N-acetyltransferase
MLREGTLDDIPRAAALRQRAWPESIVTEEGMRHWIAGVPARAEHALFAWEDGGELVGWANAGRSWWHSDPAAGLLAITVDPSRRGEGIGTALAEAADAHLARLEVRTTRAGSLDEPGARALASSRGFTEIAAATVSSVDPRAVEPRPVPAGVELVPLAEVDDPVLLYELDLELSQDIPNEDFDAIELDDWKAQFWRSPLIDDDASLVALVDGELAGLTMIRVDRPSGRAQNNLCGVRRPHRSRGLALLLKSHSLRRAAELGATIVLTDNDETNAPMLAVNTKLGYRPYARRLEWERTSEAATNAP